MSTSPAQGLWVEITCDGNRRDEVETLQAAGQTVTTAELTPDQLVHCYRAGGEAMKRIIETARDNAVGLIAAWTWSMNNWKRPQSHEQAVFQVMQEFLQDLEQNWIDRPENSDVRLVHLGQEQNLIERQSDVWDVLHRICDRTRKRAGMVVALLTDYSGPDEEERARDLWDNRHRISSKVKTFTDCLDLPWRHGIPFRELDLRIRTGETTRIKHTNAVMRPYAGEETRDIFHEVMLPQYTPALFIQDINEYLQTEKRQGK